jgi:hypothetical protein
MPLTRLDGRVVPDMCRQECEIWTRVMGYYRPVSEFNIGKKAEFAERVAFKIETYPGLLGSEAIQ